MQAELERHLQACSLQLHSRLDAHSERPQLQFEPILSAPLALTSQAHASEPGLPQQDHHTAALVEAGVESLPAETPGQAHASEAELPQQDHHITALVEAGVESSLAVPPGQELQAGTAPSSAGVASLGPAAAADSPEGTPAHAAPAANSDVTRDCTMSSAAPDLSAPTADQFAPNEHPAVGGDPVTEQVVGPVLPASEAAEASPSTNLLAPGDQAETAGSSPLQAGHASETETSTLPDVTETATASVEPPPHLVCLATLIVMMSKAALDVEMPSAASVSWLHCSCLMHAVCMKRTRVSCQQSSLPVSICYRIACAWIKAWHSTARLAP